MRSSFSIAADAARMPDLSNAPRRCENHRFAIQPCRNAMTHATRITVFVVALLSVMGGFVADALGQTADTSAVAAAKKRGKLIVGVKYDFPPFGYVDEQKKVVGFEVDM